MWRALIPKQDLTIQASFAFGLALHEKLHTPGQHGDLGFLAGDHVGQVFDGPLEVRQFFFHGVHDAIY